MNKMAEMISGLEELPCQFKEKCLALFEQVVNKMVGYNMETKTFIVKTISRCMLLLYS